METWYVVTFIFKCEIEGEPTNTDLWTCIGQVHVIRASNRDLAYEKAMTLGKSHEHSYENADGQTVRWLFVGLENLEELLDDEIRDGTEICGRVFDTHNPESLVVSKKGLNVFYKDVIANKTAREILETGIETRLIVNRVRI